MSKDSEEKKKEKKRRLVTIIARTTSDEINCGKVLKHCLKKLIESPENEVMIFVEKAHCINSSGKHVTHVLVIGDSNGGWQKGMQLFCDCLESSGFLVQAVLADQSIIPSSSCGR
ncbi:MAG: hypothetical protein HGA36_03310 [Candidatus Moranbacteria bacterium]|nr:hypothetical protein [Candidatus Moranbacteria bacterium]